MFYTFNQNNSGGKFRRDEQAGIGELVIIEAPNASEANSRAESIGIYFNGCNEGMDCPCCGDRWHSVSDSDADETPSLYGKSIYEQEIEMFWDHAFIHYLSGRIERVEFKAR